MEDKLCRDTNNSFLLCGTIPGTVVLWSNATADGVQRVNMSTDIPYSWSTTEGIGDVMLPPGLLNISIHGGYQETGDKYPGSETRVTTSDFTLIAAVNESKSQTYNSNGGTLTYNVGSGSIKVEIVTYPKHSNIEGCTPISMDEFLQNWDYECREQRQSGFIEIEAIIK